MAFVVEEYVAVVWGWHCREAGEGGLGSFGLEILQVPRGSGIWFEGSEGRWS